MAPRVVKGTEVCVTIAENGITFYGNKEAFMSLSRYMSHLAKSEPSEHNELHLFWHLTPLGVKDGSAQSNIWALFDKKTFRAFHQPKNDMEVTFMVVEQDDLEKLKKSRDSRTLPVDWVSKREHIQC